MSAEADGWRERLEARVTELEIKAAFAEDTVDRLNEVIIRQQDRIDRLVAELAQLRQTVSRGIASNGNAAEETPPHY